MYSLEIVVTLCYTVTLLHCYTVTLCVTLSYIVCHIVLHCVSHCHIVVTIQLFYWSVRWGTEQDLSPGTSSESPAWSPLVSRRGQSGTPGETTRSAQWSPAPWQHQTWSHVPSLFSTHKREREREGGEREQSGSVLLATKTKLRYEDLVKRNWMCNLNY